MVPRNMQFGRFFRDLIVLLRLPGTHSPVANTHGAQLLYNAKYGC